LTRTEKAGRTDLTGFEHSEPGDQHGAASVEIKERDMKYLKILGLAAMAAAALMAFAGAGTASAETTACEVTEEPCTTHGWGVGTQYVSHLEFEPLVMTAGGGLVEINCQKSTTKGEFIAATTPVVQLSEFTLEECNNTAEVLNPGKLVFHHDTEHNGTVTTKEFKIRFKASGLTCTFGGEIKEGVTLTAGSEPTIDKTATVPLKEGFFCPSSAVWHAKYKITEPKPLYITTGV
jgi:hypothetical protein